MEEGFRGTWGGVGIMDMCITLLVGMFSWNIHVSELATLYSLTVQFSESQSWLHKAVIKNNCGTKHSINSFQLEIKIEFDQSIFLYDLG